MATFEPKLFKGVKRVGNWQAAVEKMGVVSEVPLPQSLTIFKNKTAGKLYRSSMPLGSYDSGGAALPQWIKMGVDLVVNLTSLKEVERKTGWPSDELYIPFKPRVAIQFDLRRILDDDPLTKENVNIVRKALGKCKTALKTGGIVVCHCSGGVGRTGVFLSLLLKMLAKDDNSGKYHSQLDAAMKRVKEHIHQSLDRKHENATRRLDAKVFAPQNTSNSPRVKSPKTPQNTLNSPRVKSPKKRKASKRKISKLPTTLRRSKRIRLRRSQV